LVDAGIGFDPDLQVCAGYTAPLAREAICGWIERHRGEPLPEAVFCANDAAAIGCLEAFAEYGVRVPDDVSVAGFDDTYAAQAASPMLTSVRQPLADMGAHAVELLLKKISTPESGVGMNLKSIVFPVTVIHRASVANRIEATVAGLGTTRSMVRSQSNLPATSV
jgi:LacI family transcriptional regulator